MDDEQLDILAWTMLGEAGGTGVQGMADVGNVVLNRLETGRWGSTIKDVAQANKQFSTWNSGAGGNDPQGTYPKSSPAFQRARQLAEQVVAGQIQGPPGKPLDYHATNISPYWADSKNKYGAIVRNGHTFYPSTPVPPGEIPNTVGTRTDTIAAGLPPAPVTPSPDMSLMRKAAPASSLIADSFSRISQSKNQSGSSGLDLSLSGRPNAVTPRLTPEGDNAYTYWLPDATPTSLTGGMGSLTPSIGQVPKPATMSAHLSAQRATDPALASALAARYPVNRLPEIPGPSPMLAKSAPIPQMQSPDLQAQRSGKPWETVASIPTNGVGQPPATRTVQSVPMPAVTQTAQASPYSYMFGRPPTQAIPERLASGEAGMPALYGTISPQQVAMTGVPAFGPNAPMPFDRPENFGVGGGAAPPFPMPASMRPKPQPQPNFGMGGPVVNQPSIGGGFAPQPAPRSLRPPTPMPRLERPGLSIGPFQVGGPIGAITRAMANSSGPFNNGGDNALYNLMRGGDFNTPGAATHQSASGYLFAPKQGGGFTNVGRANPQMSPAMTYAMANARDSRGNTQGGFASQGKSDYFREVTGI